MSSFNCEKCGTPCLDTGSGYVTGCKHYPADHTKMILIGCEESQVITKAFRDAGFEAYSCDLEPTRGNKNWHFQIDIMKLIPMRQWDLIILHPECTALAVSGNGTYGLNTDKTPKPKHYLRLEAIEWTKALWEIAKKHSPRVALENPNSVIFPHLRKMGALVKYYQPYEHGHGETKRTGMALHGLEPLKPSNEVEGREQRVWKMGPSDTRSRDRSETLPGVAKAIVNQWGAVL